MRKTITTVIDECDWTDCEEEAAAFFSYTHWSHGSKPHQVMLCAEHDDVMQDLGEPDISITCPEPGCGATSTTRAGLGTHVRRYHGKGLKAYK